MTIKNCKTSQQPIHNSALKILVCYHKPYTMPPNDDGILLPIQAGKALTDTDLHMQADNELNGQPCDNISSKNPIYNELTAIYWAWKNLKKICPETKYIGLFHYKRFFAFDEKKFCACAITKPKEAISHYSLDPEKIIRILDSEKVILAKKHTLPFSVAAHYCTCHVSDNYRTVDRIIKQKFPDYYEAFQDVMKRSNKFSPFNMFIMKWEDFEKYSEWLFAVLAEAEHDYQMNPNPYQKRLFISERLLNVYIRKHKLRAKLFNIYHYNETIPHRKSKIAKARLFMNRFFTACKYDLMMFIMNLNLKFNSPRKLFKQSH